MGESALTSHVKGKKHIELSKPKTFRLPDFFQPTVTVAATATITRNGEGLQEAVPMTTTTTVPSTVPRQSTLQSESGTESLKAEILWCLKVVTSHYSFSASEKSKYLFQSMFPDSKIAANFSCGETKCQYLCCHGIAPYFRQLMLDKVKTADEYVLLFDESLNNKTQTKQLDIHVRFWENDRVCTRYLNMGHATAADLMDSFYESTSGLPLKKVVQLSMDGPNVNWKFFEDLNSKIKQDFSVSLLNIGSCGLHIMHNAFKNGALASTWDIDHLLFCLHTLFKDSPARRKDFTKIVGTGEFPLKFCKHRWVENSRVVDRAIQIWPNVSKYVKAVEGKKIPNPKTKSFQIVKDNVNDKLILAKLSCFSSIAKQVEPFLILYQTDKPMIPFLCSDLEKLIRELMDRIIKSEVLKEADTVHSLLKIDVTDKKNHADSKRIKVGFKADKILTDLKFSKKISDLQVLEFIMECKEFIIALVQKLLEKCPVKYSIVRNMGCLDPRQMSKDKQKCENKLKRILHLLVLAGRVNEDKCDQILRELNLFIEETVASRLTEFSTFDPKTDRVDVVLYGAMSGSQNYKDLFLVTKMLLSLSHGQASVERGFSVNRHVEVDNLAEQSYTALRIICDYVTHVGGILNVLMEKPLLISAVGARQKYLAHLDEQKRKLQSETQNLRRKTINEEIDELKAKRQRLTKDREAMCKTADQFSDKAETSRNLTWVAKSNSLRRSAKEKKQTLSDVEKSIDEKLQDLKNN